MAADHILNQFIVMVSFFVSLFQNSFSSFSLPLIYTLSLPLQLYLSTFPFLSSSSITQAANHHIFSLVPPPLLFISQPIE